MLELKRGADRAFFDPDDGARLTELVLGGHSLLVPYTGQRSMWWGAFVMAPWTSLLHSDSFDVDGSSYELMAESDEDRWHGVARKERWVLDTDGSMHAVLAHAWPLGGSAILSAALQDSSLLFTISITAGRHSMPAALGWHPWFRRDLSAQADVDVRIPPQGLLVGRDSPPFQHGGTPAEGWNDCFRTSGPIDLHYVDVGTLQITFSSAYVTIFSKHQQGVCVEPVTAPPGCMDVLLHPGKTLDLTVYIEWIES